jgi:acetate kinase
MMGTRCGVLDPGVVLHLQTQLGMSPATVEAMLYNQSGLLGVSGLSSDMRALAASDAREAAEAVELFVWRVAREIAALGSALGGIDGIVFTAGIGENSAEVRSLICRRLEWLGVELDELANAGDYGRINQPDSRIAVHVIPTDEERMIALHTLNVLKEIRQ